MKDNFCRFTMRPHPILQQWKTHCVVVGFGQNCLLKDAIEHPVSYFTGAKSSNFQFEYLCLGVESKDLTFYQLVAEDAVPDW